jgi:hypothetical protein
MRGRGLIVKCWENEGVDYIFGEITQQVGVIVGGVAADVILREATDSLADCR